MVVEMSEFLSPSQAARRAEVDPDTIRSWVKRGRLPGTRTPVGLIIKVDDLDRVIAERQATRRAS